MAAKVQWQKIKKNQAKKVKIWKFYIHKSQIPQNEAKNVYNTDSKRKDFIFLGKNLKYQAKIGQNLKTLHT